MDDNTFVRKNILDPFYNYPLPGRGNDSVGAEVSEAPQKKFDNLVENADQVLLNIKSVFPLDFFPDQVTVDSNKVNIIRNHFLAKKVHSVFIRDISDVFIYNGILFASLSIVDMGYVENQIDIRYLWKSDAIQARKVIQGLVIGAKQGVDLSKVDLNNKAVESLGEAKGAE